MIAYLCVSQSHTSFRPEDQQYILAERRSVGFLLLSDETLHVFFPSCLLISLLAMAFHRQTMTQHSYFAGTNFVIDSQTWRWLVVSQCFWQQRSQYLPWAVQVQQWCASDTFCLSICVKIKMQPFSSLQHDDLDLIWPSAHAECNCSSRGGEVGSS